MAYRVSFLFPDDGPLGLEESVDMLAEKAPKAIACRTDGLGSYDEADIYICLGFPKNPLDGRYALVLSSETTEIVNKGTRAVFEGAFMTVFASPEQLAREKRRWVGTNWSCPTIALPPAVDPALFLDGRQKRNGAVWMGKFDHRAGLRDAIEWAKDKRVRLYMYGEGRPFLWLRDYYERPTNAGDLRLESWPSILERPDIYNRAVSLVYFPKEFEPCPAQCVEAILCGCRVETNGNNGFTSWGWSAERWASEMKVLPDKFWRALVMRMTGG